LTPRNLGSLLTDTAGRFPDKKALLYKENGQILSLTWSEFSYRARSAASFLVRQGIKPGDRIAILSENRPEWAILDMGAQLAGIATVPIYTSLTPHEIQYLLSDSGAVFIAVSSKPLFEKISQIQKELPALKGVLAFDTPVFLLASSLTVPLHLFKDVSQEKPSEDLLRSLETSVKGDALASIIYTSGTTGPPKGVLLTHQNFISNLVYAKAALKMGETDAHLSFLPLSHVFERMAGHYLMIYIGASIAYAENMDTVPRDLLDFKPTFVLGVPRFYEKIQSRVMGVVSRSSPIRKGIFAWARSLRALERSGKHAQKIQRISYRAQYALAEILVYKKFRQRLGGRVRFGISGGAALPKEVAEFFYDLGVLILEGYGLTETSPVISVNREEKFRFGTVGVPLKDVEVRISQDGEILTRSACVMKGYFNKPAETDAVLSDGWFHTGDLGQIDKDGFLSITGRKKELIVTSGGKKVSPRIIEEQLETDPWILRCVLFGEGRKFITALIVPEREKLEAFAVAERIAYQNYADLLKNPRVLQAFTGRVEELCKDLASYEKIKYFALLENDFTQTTGELTPTLKVKREVVYSRYKDLLLPFYEKENKVI
jgi:long-chain acyl-CoA synthetase